MFGVKSVAAFILLSVMGASAWADEGAGKQPVTSVPDQADSDKAEAMDAELLAFIADWLGDDGEWVDPSTLDGRDTSLEEDNDEY